LSLDAYREERDYLDLPTQDETSVGAVFRAGRELASNLRGDFELSYYTYERTVPSALPGARLLTNDRDTQAVLTFTRTSSPRLSLIAESGYLTRSRDADIGGTADYDGFWLILRVRWTP
jgi:hypothetical protein